MWSLELYNLKLAEKYNLGIGKSLTKTSKNYISAYKHPKKGHVYL